MSQTILVKDGKTATIACPSCHNVRKHDVSSFMGVKATRVRIRCRCTCDATFHVILERRLYPRKAVTLPVVVGVDTLRYKLQGTITDISQSGLKMSLSMEEPLSPDTTGRVTFYLDDCDSTHIEKSITIRNINGFKVGAEFDSTTHYGKLGPYIEFR